MHARTTELLRHLDAALAGLFAALAQVPAERRDMRPPGDGWSAANVLSHLARTAGQVAALLQRALQRALADDALPAAAETGSVLAGDGLDTSTLRHAHHVLGELTFEQWIEFVGCHQQRHTAQLRDLAERLATS
jgi:hypothetical protein